MRFPHLLGLDFTLFLKGVKAPMYCSTVSPYVLVSLPSFSYPLFTLNRLNYLKETLRLLMGSILSASHLHF